MALVLESAFQECYACAFLPEATHKIRLGWRRTIKAYKLATINYKPLQSANSIDASARARCQLEAAPAHVDGHGASLPVSNGPLARVTSPGEPGLLSLGTGSAALAL